MRTLVFVTSSSLFDTATFEMPKSSTLTSGAPWADVMKMFEGLRSR